MEQVGVLLFISFAFFYFFPCFREVPEAMVASALIEVQPGGAPCDSCWHMSHAVNTVRVVSCFRLLLQQRIQKSAGRRVMHLSQWLVALHASLAVWFEKHMPGYQRSSGDHHASVARVWWDSGSPRARSEETEDVCDVFRWCCELVLHGKPCKELRVWQRMKFKAKRSLLPEALWAALWALALERGYEVQLMGMKLSL